MKQSEWTYTNFRPSEFDSPDRKGSGLNMTKDFMDKLQRLRDYIGFPLIIVSGFRTSEKNSEVDGVSDSSHMKGCAVDVLAKTSSRRYAIIKGAMHCGINRIGINRTTIHLDTDSEKADEVLWHYYK